MPDLGLLKAVTDREATDCGPAESAVSSVLEVLRNHPDDTLLWHDIYYAVKESYVPPPIWDDEGEDE